jgi:hypothetical protein
MNWVERDGPICHFYLTFTVADHVKVNAVLRAITKAPLMRNKSDSREVRVCRPEVGLADSRERSLRPDAMDLYLELRAIGFHLSLRVQLHIEFDCANSGDVFYFYQWRLPLGLGTPAKASMRATLIRGSANSRSAIASSLSFSAKLKRCCARSLRSCS